MLSLVILSASFVIYLKWSIEDQRVAQQELLNKGPWSQGGIWSSEDGNYYLVPAESVNSAGLYGCSLYACVGDAWFKAGFSPEHHSPAGRSNFFGTGFDYYVLYWKASLKEGALVLKTERYPVINYDRLPCPRKIIFKKTDKTIDDLPFKEDYKELLEKVQSQIQERSQ